MSSDEEHQQREAKLAGTQSGSADYQKGGHEAIANEGASEVKEGLGQIRGDRQ